MKRGICFCGGEIVRVVLTEGYPKGTSVSARTKYRCTKCGKQERAPWGKR